MTKVKGIAPSHLADHVSLEILVNNRPIKQYKHNKKVYIEGRAGSNYSLRVKNENDTSVYVIVSVDGLSVIDGKQASEKSVGFLIKKKNSVSIPGWLISGTSAAQFTFSEKKSSYSEKINEDNTNNVGVIGCIVIAEKDEEKKDQWEELWEQYKQLEKRIDDENRHKCPYPAPYPVPYPVYPTSPLVPWTSPWDWDYYRPRPYWTSTPVYYSNNIGGLGVGSVTGDSGYCGNSISNTANFGNFSIAGDEASGINCNSNVGNNTAEMKQWSNMSSTASASTGFSDKDFSYGEATNNISIGTGFGKKVEMKEVDTDKPFDIGEVIKSFVVFYDTRKNLEKIGISFEKKKIVKKDPNPFPASKIKFCEPPEDWE
jgi:hypothetical protein